MANAAKHVLMKTVQYVPIVKVQLYVCKSAEGTRFVQKGLNKDFAQQNFIKSNDAEKKGPNLTLIYQAEIAGLALRSFSYLSIHIFLGRQEDREHQYVHSSGLAPGNIPGDFSTFVAKARARLKMV